MKLFLYSGLALVILLHETHQKKHSKHHKKPVAMQNIHIPEIPVVQPLTINSCPCAGSATNQNSACRPALYMDYYYKEPYSGYPESQNYLPPEETVPIIVERLTQIRDEVKGFVAAIKREPDNVKKAIYVKTNFDSVKYILRAINRAANSTVTAN